MLQSSVWEDTELSANEYNFRFSLNTIFLHIYKSSLQFSILNHTNLANLPLPCYIKIYFNGMFPFKISSSFKKYFPVRFPD
jgi:hypothetical protein